MNLIFERFFAYNTNATANFRYYLMSFFFFLEFADPLEHATGLEKRELLAIQSGNTDPFNSNILERGPGTKDKPNLVASAFDSRIVGCICKHNLTRTSNITACIVIKYTIE